MLSYQVTEFSKPLARVAQETPRPTGRQVLIRTTAAGVCHSDLHIWDGYYDLGGGKRLTLGDRGINLPLTMGHEVVGEDEEGRRVVLEPVLGPEARGFVPPWPDAAPGDGDDYGHLVTGELEPGIQIGYCASTGGGWSSRPCRPRPSRPG